MENFFEIKAFEETEEHVYPKYSDTTRILVQVSHGYDDRGWEYDVIDDDGGCIFWINEGMGVDYWIDDYCTFEEPGTYVIEGITGRFYRGTWGFDDDDEDWEYTLIRPATEEEKINGLA